LLDHIIFNRSGYFSFLEAGRLLPRGLYNECGPGVLGESALSQPKGQASDNTMQLTVRMLGDMLSFKEKSSGSTI